MPELPEVETIRQQLKKQILGRKITKIEILEPRAINVSQSRFKKGITGAKIIDILRRAKLLIFKLSNGNYFVVHLKLTGRLLFVKEKTSTTRYTRIIFYLSEGHKLFFDDLRKFGYIKFFDKEGLQKFLKKEKFGIDPLDRKFTSDIFSKLLAKRSRSKIKPLLMDQSFLAGVGNVYAQEACFYAKIAPTRTAGSLSPKEIKDLHNGLRKVLISAIKKKGASVDTYVDIYGRQGGFVPHLQVYGRKGKSCYRCNGKIKSIKLGGRGTYFCPKCQK